MIDCPICARIESIKNNLNENFVKELQTGYIVLGDHQYYKGYTLFLSKIHAKELYELEKEFRLKFLEEMSHVAKAVFEAFKPAKLNYELLGNKDEHLHWHLFPRYKSDKNRQAPIWIIPENIRNSTSTIPLDEERENLKKKLLEALKN